MTAKGVTASAFSFLPARSGHTADAEDAGIDTSKYVDEVQTCLELYPASQEIPESCLAMPLTIYCRAAGQNGKLKRKHRCAAESCIALLTLVVNGKQHARLHVPSQLQKAFEEAQAARLAGQHQRSEASGILAMQQVLVLHLAETPNQ